MSAREITGHPQPGRHDGDLRCPDCGAGLEAIESVTRRVDYDQARFDGTRWVVAALDSSATDEFVSARLRCAGHTEIAGQTLPCPYAAEVELDWV